VGLGLVLGVEVVMLVVQMARPMPTIQIPSEGLEPDSADAPPASGIEPMPSLVQAAPRALFAPPVVSAGSSPTQPQGQSAKLLEGRLTLTGIITGDPPQAIIEDAETKKTYFVNPGQAVAEGAVLEQVLENRVILNLQGDKIELGL
jgi:hypothetical protein